MIPKIDRSRLFYGAVVVHDGEYTWLWNGMNNSFTLFKNGETAYPILSSSRVASHIKQLEKLK